MSAETALASLVVICGVLVTINIALLGLLLHSWINSKTAKELAEKASRDLENIKDKVAKLEGESGAHHIWLSKLSGFDTNPPSP